MTGQSRQRVQVLDSVRAAALPAGSILARYQVDGTYADCFVARVSGDVGHAEFVSAFYTTWLFRVERTILTFAARRPSNDKEAAELAQGLRDEFAAWRVEGRCHNQLLLCDFTGRTRSWLMTIHDSTGTPSTLLYFGSAVVPSVDPDTGAASLGTTYRLLLGFHKQYSRMLLRAACAHLSGTQSNEVHSS